MKSKILLFTASSLLLLGSCKKKEEDTTPKDFGELKTRVIFNFAEDVGLKAYADLNNAIIKMATSAENYYYTGTIDDYEILKNDWKKANMLWEQTESFQFGPVFGGEYHIKMDSWPARPVEYETLIYGSNPLEVSDIEKLNNNLRGFHSMEYVLFGEDGKRAGNTIDWRPRKYLLNLAKDLKNNSTVIYNAWTAGSTNFGSELVFTGKGGKTFATKQALFSAMANNMGDLCSKILVENLSKPYDKRDSTDQESPFANGSLADIVYNINSLKSVYTGRYDGSTGYGIKDLVKDKKASLDTKLSERIKSVDSAVSQIPSSLDSAVLYYRAETKIAIDAMDSLRSTIQKELVPFIKENITD